MLGGVSAQDARCPGRRSDVRYLTVVVGTYRIASKSVSGSKYIFVIHGARTRNSRSVRSPQKNGRCMPPSFSLDHLIGGGRVISSLSSKLPPSNDGGCRLRPTTIPASYRVLLSTSASLKCSLRIVECGGGRDYGGGEALKTA